MRADAPESRRTRVRSVDTGCHKAMTVVVQPAQRAASRTYKPAARSWDEIQLHAACAKLTLDDAATCGEPDDGGLFYNLPREAEDTLPHASSPCRRHFCHELVTSTRDTAPDLPLHADPTSVISDAAQLARPATLRRLFSCWHV